MCVREGGEETERDRRVRLEVRVKYRPHALPAQGGLSESKRKLVRKNIPKNVDTLRDEGSEYFKVSRGEKRKEKVHRNKASSPETKAKKDGGGKKGKTELKSWVNTG